MEINLRSKFSFKSKVLNVFKRLLAVKTPATVNQSPLPLTANTPLQKYKASFRKESRRGNLRAIPQNS